MTDQPPIFRHGTRKVCANGVGSVHYRVLCRRCSGEPSERLRILEALVCAVRSAVAHCGACGLTVDDARALDVLPDGLYDGWQGHPATHPSERFRVSSGFAQLCDGSMEPIGVARPVEALIEDGWALFPTEEGASE